MSNINQICWILLSVKCKVVNHQVRGEQGAEYFGHESYDLKSGSFCKTGQIVIRTG